MDIFGNISSGCKSQTKMQHLMSVSNFLVVNIPTKKVSISPPAINEVQKNIKSLKSLFQKQNKTKNKKNKRNKKKFKLTFKVRSHFMKSHSQKPMESL